MQLPARYAWLANEPGPKMLVEALKHYGVLEYRGADNNPDITAWAKEIGGDIASTYTQDSIPWCGLFMAIVAKRAGKTFPANPLWALNWKDFGVKATVPMLGDVVVFSRTTPTGGKAGHVALYVGEDNTAYHTLGGNQSDSVCITRMAKSRLYAVRRPIYNVQPANVRKVVLASDGNLSVNEQ